MKWNKFTLKTLSAVEDIVISTLAEAGVEGVEIEDKVPLTEQDKQQMFVHDRRGFSRKIYAGFSLQAELFKIAVIIINAKPQSHLNKYRIARVHGSLYKILSSVTGHLVTADAPVLHNLKPRTTESVI